MSLTFTRAPIVASGDPITSTQLAKLADAFNDRLRSGIGDPTWRIHFWWLGLFRQVRNPDETGFVFPPQGEFFDIYQHLNPDQVQWPLTGPGEPEGANVANPMMAYVFGAAAPGVASETERYADLVWPQGEPDARQAWLHAKYQRGAVDPHTGALASPAFHVASSHYAIAQSERSPHGNAYGGFLPLPNIGENCEDPNPDDDIPAPVNYVYRFTRLQPLSGTTGVIQKDVSYTVIAGEVEYDGVPYLAGQEFTGVEGVSDYTDTAGGSTVTEVLSFESCQPVPGGEEYPDHVAWIVRAPFYYAILLYGGGVIVLPTNAWVEGPYTGEARLRKTPGDHLPRSLWHFVREFRGTTNQRADQTYHLEHAFDFQAFFTRQYKLAPQIGVETVGPDGESQVEAAYPEFRVSGPALAGQWLDHSQGGGSVRFFQAGFALTGAFIEAEGLSSDVRVEVMVDDAPVATIALSRQPDGTATALWMPERDFHPVKVGFRLASGLESGSLRAEITELLPYLPQMHDVAMYIRAAACIPSQPDGVGIHETDAKLLSDDYFRHGCIINRAGIPGIEGLFAEVNPNAVYDAARRMSKVVRVPRRQELAGYAVENGRSILWFRRYAFGLSNATPADVWEGIAPDRDYIVSGSIKEGFLYEVREGSIEYDGKTYVQGERFVGSSTGDFGGGGKVYEADGIRHTAQPHDYTNEWLLGCDFIAYHPSESSIWKPSVYSDYFPHLVNRCHFYSPYIATDIPTLWHFSFGQRIATDGVAVAEAPPGYNYARLQFSFMGATHANMQNCAEEDEACIEQKRNFYRSCRLYEPDIEVDKCEIEVSPTGEELVKVTLKGRLHHCAEAPASIGRDISSWDIGALKAEPFRSVENGIREYLIHEATGTHCTFAGQPGNSAIVTSVYSNPDAPFGTCYPKFRLTKLIPKPYEDSNDTQDSSDTRFEHDPLAMAELYLRCMCEGYVDGRSSAELACRNGTISVYDYSYTSLCLQAFGNRWVTAFTSEDNPENPQAYGPIPNTIARAEVFNQLSAAVNLLTTVRVMLPATLEAKIDYAEKSRQVTALHADGSPAECFGPTSAERVYWDGIPPSANEFTEGDWEPSSGATIVASSNLTGHCISGTHELRTEKERVTFRWRLVDPDAIHAIPEHWRDNLDMGGTVLAQTVTYSAVYGRGQTDNIDEAESCAGVDWWFMGGDRYLTFPADTSVVVDCVMSDHFDLPDLPSSNHFRAYTTGAGGAECGGGPGIRKEIGIISTDTATITFALVD
jgi:hypothetical protein